MATAYRVYFFDMSRPRGQRELVDHPANGMPWVGFGSMATDSRGVFIPGSHRSVEGISPRALAAGVGTPGRMRNEVSVTRKDFPGTGLIRVKFWAPEGGLAEWSDLLEDEPLAPTAPPAVPAGLDLGEGEPSRMVPGCQQFVVEASTLRLQGFPGELRLGGTPLLRYTRERDRSGEEVIAMHYVNREARIHLVVLND